MLAEARRVEREERVRLSCGEPARMAPRRDRGRHGVKPGPPASPLQGDRASASMP